jgi:hypothetical protein
MSTPVFVIHGIGSRDQGAFESTVQGLGRAAGFVGHPVFWGDLGARTALVDATVPGAAQQAGGPEIRDGAEAAALSDPDRAMAEFLAGTGEQRTDVIRDGDVELPPEVLEAALGRLRADGGVEVRDTPAGAEMEQALRSEWPGTRWLTAVDDPDVLRAVGAALTGPLTDEDLTPGGAEIRGVDVRGFVRRRLQELDRVVGAVLGAAGGRVNSHLRTATLPGIAQSVGDILVYQRHKERIQARVREVVAGVDPELGRSPERPIDVVAHSLGGVIAVDMATADDPLWVRCLVTFGSQSPLFHVCDPRGGTLDPFEGTALVRLPPSVGAWTNLWEPLDALAFIAARVFQLNDGSAPDDRAVPHLASTGLWSHSAYWTLDSVARAIGNALAPP